jgi:FixJ family two-component response regulator
MTKDHLIVIVDDDDALRASLDNLIRSVGYRARGFSSAEAFLKFNHLHDTVCLILDVRMAGMNGLRLQRELVAAKWPIPIIFMTSYADEAVRTEALAAGAIDFLYKPFMEDSLLKALDKAIQLHEPTMRPSEVVARAENPPIGDSEIWHGSAVLAQDRNIKAGLPNISGESFV